MPKVTEEHRLARREQILEAALNCFARNGFHRTSMKDICKEAGLSAGAMYLHFSSKEDIIEATMRRNQEARGAHIAAVAQEGYTPQVWDEIWSLYAKRLADPELDRMWKLLIQVFAEALRSPQLAESVRRNWDDAEERIAGFIRETQAYDASDSELDCNVRARVCIAFRDGLLLQKIIDPQQDILKIFESFRSLIQPTKKC